MNISATQNELTEWGYTAGKYTGDPFNTIELDVILTHQSGKKWRAPMAWALISVMTSWAKCSRARCRP